MERWKDVVGYEGLYQVSDLGRIRSVDRVVQGPRGEPKRLKGRVLLLNSRKSTGHIETRLWKEGVNQAGYVHRFVMAAWIGPCPEGCEVSHINEDPADNRVCNLCYLPRKEHNRKDQGKCVSRSDGKVFDSGAEAAEKTGCDASAIGRVCNGKRKTAGGWGWTYKEGGDSCDECND